MQAYILSLQKTFFSESSNVAYQIKGKGVESSMQSNILFLHTLSAPEVGVKRSKRFFSENSHVAYQIKENRA